MIVSMRSLLASFLRGFLPNKQSDHIYVLLVWWMTSKSPNKTAQLEGVQTSPYSGFVLQMVY